MGRPPGWLTEEEFFARFRDEGWDDVSPRQLERWRYEGVLQPVLQDPLNGDGSVTYYPPGSCEQAAAVRDLLRKKRKFEYVGWELWWSGSWVEDRHWKRELQDAAKTLDRYLRYVSRLIARDEKSNSRRTIFDRAARSSSSNFILSRVRRRLQIDDLATVFRVFLKTASGDFHRYEPHTGPDTRTLDQIAAGMKLRSHDENQTIAALDINQSEKDAIVGKRLNLTGSLLGMLRDISAALRDGTLTEVIDSETEVTNARDDVRNGMRIALSLFEATQWIYGPQAFGLRLANWVAKKGNRRAKASFILIWLRLRTHSSDLPSSQEIALLADEAEKIRDQSRQLRTLARNDKRFEKVFCPKRFHKALKDKISFDRFLKEIEAARMS